MRYLTLILISVLFYGNASAQDCWVKVVNEKQKPIYGVSAINLNNPEQVFTTNKEGKVNLFFNNQQSIKFLFEHPNYNFKILTVHVSECNRDYTVVLFPSKSLNSTVIEVDNKEKAFTLNSVENFGIYEGRKTEVIEPAKLSANLATNNAREVYTRVAGLNIWESDGAGIQLGIGGRGLNPNRTSNFNVRQNGYDISADALGYPESYYTPPLDAVERIEIVRGAASLQYGTQFGGLLNFELKKHPHDSIKFEAITKNTAGSFGFLSTFNSVGGTLDSYRTHYNAFYQYKQGNGWRENSDFNVHTYHINLKRHITEKFSLSAEYTGMQYLAQQAGGLTDVMFERNPRESIRERNWFSVDWNLMSLKAQYTINNTTAIDFRTFGLLANRKALGVLSPINVLDLGGERNLISGSFSNIGAETRLLKRYNVKGMNSIFLAGNRLYYGKTTNSQGVGSDGSDANFNFATPNPSESDYLFPNHNTAFFAENILYLTDAMSITPGIRYEHINTISQGYYNQRVYDFAGNLVSTREIQESNSNKRDFLLGGLGISYKSSLEFETYANFSQNYRAINFSDLRIVNPNFKIDSNLTDERGYTADIGIRGGKKGRFYYDVSGFYISYKNRIGVVLQTDNLLKTEYRYRTNIGNSVNYGLESYTEVEMIGERIKTDDISLTLFGNFAWVNATYTEVTESSIQGNKVEMVPPITIRTGFNFKYKAFRLGANYSYVEEHFTDATNAIRTSRAVDGIIPSYQVVDASIGYSKDRWGLSINCNNALNAMYFTRRAEGYPGPGIIPSEGRSLFATFSYKFVR